jgi:ABC-type Fe3+/spermidine/putrescine transport system ATPase subunit
MNGGRVEQIGTQMDIYLEPRTPFVAEFIGANNVIPGVVESVAAAAVGDASGDAGGAPVDVTMRADDLVLRGRGRGDLAVGDRVVAYLRPEDITVLDEGAPSSRANVVEAEVERVIFEGPTVQLRVRVGDRPMRVDVGGGRRLSIASNAGKLRLEFEDLTIIPATGASAVSGVVDGGAEPESVEEAAS